MQEERIIISLGGSLIVPEEIDVNFLKSFREVILSQVEKGKKFVIITGGGKVCRKYQNAAEELNPSINDIELDWIGINSLRLNAQFVKSIFGDFAHERVIKNLLEEFSSEKPIIMGSAYKPGHSTDADAVFAAKTLNARTIINLSNTDHVYDSDPKTNPDAKMYEKITWDEYLKLIPEEWKPGLSSPFDPVASREAKELGIQVIIMNGKPAENLASYLNGERFEGTIIS